MRTMKSMVLLAGLAAFGMTISSANAAVWGPNLVTNGDFESGTTTGWLMGSNDGTYFPQPLTVSNDVPSGGGNYSMASDVTPNQSGANVVSAYWQMAAVPGNYKLEFDVKNTGGSLYYTVSHNNVDGYFGNSIGDGSANWFHLVVNYTLTQPTSYEQLYLFPINGDGPLLIDNVDWRMEVVPEPASFVLFGLPALALGLRRRRR